MANKCSQFTECVIHDKPYDNTNCYALHLAAKHGCNRNVIQALCLGYPRAVVSCDDAGLSPLDLAKRRANPIRGVLTLLEHYASTMTMDFDLLDLLEAAAAKAAAEFEEAKSAKPRPAQMELLRLASAEAEAREAAEKKMERYLELEEMMSGS